MKVFLAFLAVVHMQNRQARPRVRVKRFSLHCSHVFVEKVFKLGLCEHSVMDKVISVLVFIFQLLNQLQHEDGMLTLTTNKGEISSMMKSQTLHYSNI